MSNATAVDTAALRKLADEATPGPWRAEWWKDARERRNAFDLPPEHECYFGVWEPMGKAVCVGELICGPNDMRFIAATRTALPALLDSHDALKARCAALADKLDTALDYIGLEDSQIAVSPSELMAFIDAACALLQPAQEEAEDAQ